MVELTFSVAKCGIEPWHEANLGWSLVLGTRALGGLVVSQRAVKSEASIAITLLPCTVGFMGIIALHRCFRISRLYASYSRGSSTHSVSGAQVIRDDAFLGNSTSLTGAT